MNVLILISQHIKISELRKINLLFDDLINAQYRIYLLNNTNREAKYLLKKTNYDNYQIIGYHEQSTSLIEDFQLIINYPIDKAIVIGLNSFDYFSYYLEQFIGSNIDLYMIVPSFQIRSDATFFINQGAYIYNSIDDLKL